MSKFICSPCVWGIHKHDVCPNTWTGSNCACKITNVVLCSICKTREAIVHQSDYMRRYATADRVNEQWVYRIWNNIPDLCDPCDKRLWSG